MYVPMLTYQAPQMKYWRNMKTERRSLMLDCECELTGVLSSRVDEDDEDMGQVLGLSWEEDAIGA
jgi:hypothetical protein